MRPESSGKASLSHFCSASERSDGRFSVASRIISALAHSAVSPLSGLALSRNKDQRTYHPDLRGKTIRPLPLADRGETPERTESHIPARRARLAGAPARNAVRRTKNGDATKIVAPPKLHIPHAKARRSLDPQVASVAFASAEPIWPERPDRTGPSSPCSCRPEWPRCYRLRPERKSPSPP